MAIPTSSLGGESEAMTRIDHPPFTGTNRYLWRVGILIWNLPPDVERRVRFWFPPVPEEPEWKRPVLVRGRKRREAKAFNP